MSRSDNTEALSRLSMAREVAADLLNELEMGATPIAQSLMKAKRLARLLRDSDAQQWLDLETRGYPNKFQLATLGSCLKYAEQGGRVTQEGQYWLSSLPELEASARAAEVSLRGLQFPTNVAPGISSHNPNEFTGSWIKATVDSLMQSFATQRTILQRDYVHNTKLFNALRSALHNYATDAQLALSLGDVAENIFEEARSVVDSFVRSSCPKAAEQLLAIHERLREDNPEALAQALTSCRRVLCTAADSVFPPQDKIYTDRSGNARKVGQEEYKNRLLAFIETRTVSTTTVAIQIAELEHLAARVDAVYDKVCKGIHADVSRKEAQLAIIHTYLILAEVARVASDSASASTKATS